VTLQHWVLFVLPLLSWAGEPGVEVKGSEIWITDDRGERQLTRDGKLKTYAELSPSSTRIIYIEQCAIESPRTPSLVILDLEGHRIGSFQACYSPRIQWTTGNAVTATCGINPSLEEYIETDTLTGKNIRDLLGYWFTPSPDGKLVAHVGWIIHFAPPYAQSNYLQIDRLTIYPLPEGMHPVEQTDLTQPPTVVRKEGQTYHGIHKFQPGLSWSPDSRHIALTDCVYDWTPNTPESMSADDWNESGVRCSVAVVSTDGKVVLFPTFDRGRDRRVGDRLSWLDSHRLSVYVNEGRTRIFDVQ
jgi:hypothetical protein